MKLACIDLDDTLAETTRTHVKAFGEAFKSFGLKPVPDKKIIRLFGLAAEKMVKKLYPKISKRLINKISRKHNEVVINASYRCAKKIKGTNEALRYLKSKGYKIVIVSNSSLEEVRRLLSQVNIKKYDKIISGDIVKKSKPDPEGINMAKKIFKAKEVIMVGDTIYDIIAGKKANARTIAVLTGPNSKNKLKKYKPDFIIRSIAEIKKVV